MSVLTPTRVSPGGVRMRLIGSFRFEIDGAAVVLPTTCQRLLAVLCLRDSVSRRRLAEALWPQTPPAQALTNLRKAVWRLQGVAGDVPMTVDTGSALELGPSVMSDVGWLRNALGRKSMNSDDDRALGDLTRADELLGDWDDDWLADERECIRQLRLHVLEQWAVSLSEIGRYGRAIEVALAALRSDPLRESAHRTVIRVHVAEGNISEAMRAFQRCRQVLIDEVGEEPSAETTALIVRSASHTR